MSEPQQLELLDWLAASSQLAFSGGCLTRDKLHPHPPHPCRPVLQHASLP
jgi:hypothetical protein